MKYRPRIYYTETDKALMWDRWQQGDSGRVHNQLKTGQQKLNV